MTEKITILGTGPAGLTAAIYSARANLNPLVIEGLQAGGQLTLTSDVENYPGFSDGILGPDLMSNFRKQAERFGARFVFGDVIKVDLKQKPFKLYIEKENFETQTLILSTGASANLFGLPNEKRLIGKGVSTCATCDGFFFRGKEIAVAGGGDSACEEATFLTKFAAKVILIHRRDKLRASKIMQERVFKNPKIQILWDTVIEDVIGEKEVTGLKLKNIKTSKQDELKLAGVFVAIGHTPNTLLFRDQIAMDEKGYIKTFGGTKTSIPGVFAAGDVQDPVYRQAVTAAGTGCMAAIDTERFLESEHK